MIVLIAIFNNNNNSNNNNDGIDEFLEDFDSEEATIKK